jgi:hypothetical protein
MSTVLDITLDLIAAGLLLDALMRRDWAASVMFGALFARGVATTVARFERKPERSAEIVSLELVRLEREQKRGAM